MTRKEIMLKIKYSLSKLNTLSIIRQQLRPYWILPLIYIYIYKHNSRQWWIHTNGLALVKFKKKYCCVIYKLFRLTTNLFIPIYLSCRNFWDKACWFLSLRVFGLLSTSLLLFSLRFGRYVLRRSSGVCRIREPSRNFELRPLLNPWGWLFWFR